MHLIFCCTLRILKFCHGSLVSSQEPAVSASSVGSAGFCQFIWQYPCFDQLLLRPLTVYVYIFGYIFGYILVAWVPYSTTWQRVDKVHPWQAETVNAFLQGTSHRGACTHHGLLQAQNASGQNGTALSLHCRCIVSALCLQVFGQKPFVSLLSCEKAAAVMYISWCLSIAIYCLGVFCLHPLFVSVCAICFSSHWVLCCSSHWRAASSKSSCVETILFSRSVTSCDPRIDWRVCPINRTATKSVKAQNTVWIASGKYLRAVTALTGGQYGRTSTLSTLIEVMMILSITKRHPSSTNRRTMVPHRDMLWEGQCELRHLYTTATAVFEAAPQLPPQATQAPTHHCHHYKHSSWSHSRHHDYGITISTIIII